MRDGCGSHSNEARQRARCLLGSQGLLTRLPRRLWHLPARHAVVLVGGLAGGFRPLTRKALAGYRCLRLPARSPLSIVQGLADDRLRVHHANDLAAAHAKFVPGYEPWLVPRAVHLQAAFAEPAEYELRIVEFFRAGLGA